MLPQKHYRSPMKGTFYQSLSFFNFLSFAHHLLYVSPSLTPDVGMSLNQDLNLFRQYFPFVSYRKSVPYLLNQSRIVAYDTNPQMYEEARAILLSTRLSQERHRDREAKMNRRQLG
jgi:hypothetical protein